ncbi:hypothetical protein CTheo_1449 [Ceratobasidium theobromae]|uniref:Alpha-ketoglutarate-dependent dioxygenase AlkB-like domain-containing protein n=1 Tax=Ceratobasidium theobromae TaxID=1582974 RepID=A0A5N5QUB0_9AGAM|nr:hypothetical protein CTheo_1449 [Ceratobasidium theobromae]
MSEQTDDGPTTKSSNITWTESSLQIMTSLKPALHSILITQLHKQTPIRVFNRFIKQIEGGRSDADNEARRHFEAWVELTFTQGGISKPLRRDSKNPKLVFLATQMLLAKGKVDQAAEWVNSARKSWGLTQVGFSHPSLVPPKGMKLDVEKTEKTKKTKEMRRGIRQTHRELGSAVDGQPATPPATLPNLALEGPSKPMQQAELDVTLDHILGKVDEIEATSEPAPTIPQLRLGQQESSQPNKTCRKEPTIGIRSSMRIATARSMKDRAVAPPAKEESTKRRSPRKRVKSLHPDSDEDPDEDKDCAMGCKVEPEGPSTECEPPASREPPIEIKTPPSTGPPSHDTLLPLPLPSRPPPLPRLSPQWPLLVDKPLEPNNTYVPRANYCPFSNDIARPALDKLLLNNYVRIPVWAKSRQELCELPYFKSMQGGVYTRGNTVYGYLLGRFPSPRDAWCHQGKLIISHGGGKHVSDEGEKNSSDPASMNKAKHQLGDDQLESDRSIQALLTAYRMFRPIVMLAEADYEHLQKFNLKQGYAEGAGYYVLGHYAITYEGLTAEKEEVNSQSSSSIYTRWKFAFQYIEGDQGPPWWTQPPGALVRRPEPPSEERVPVDKRRSFGRKVESNRQAVSEVTAESFSRQVRWRHVQLPAFDISFSGNGHPNAVTVGANGQPVQQEGLQFNPEFQELRELPEQLQKIPYPTVPEYPDWQRRRNGESIFNRYFWAGACCHNCGRVSCRQKWQYWECLTCGLRRDESRPQIYPSTILISPIHCETQGGGNFNPQDLESRCRVIRYSDGVSRNHPIAELKVRGQIVHVLNNPEATHVANQLFEQYQKDAGGSNMFQRHAMKTHGAEAVSTPFEQCPQSVVKARDHIIYLCKSALGRDVEFNEVLSVAYAEGQEMNFHSDDEPGLGPVVAGLSLGGYAEMLFRYHIACKKNMVYKNGAFKPSEVRTFDEANERVLQITLSHGDLLIMDGADIQKQYEHAVFVRDNDLVRFAATARFIEPTPPGITRPRPSTLAEALTPTIQS